MSEGLDELPRWGSRTRGSGSFFLPLLCLAWNTQALLPRLAPERCLVSHEGTLLAQQAAGSTGRQGTGRSCGLLDRVLEPFSPCQTLPCQGLAIPTRSQGSTKADPDRARVANPFFLLTHFAFQDFGSLVHCTLQTSLGRFQRHTAADIVLGRAESHCSA